MKNNYLENNDSTAENGGGTKGRGDLPANKRNYMPYILLGIAVLITLIIIFI